MTRSIRTLMLALALSATISLTGCATAETDQIPATPAARTTAGATTAPTPERSPTTPRPSDATLRTCAGLLLLQHEYGPIIDAAAGDVVGYSFAAIPAGSLRIMLGQLASLTDLDEPVTRDFLDVATALTPDRDTNILYAENARQAREALSRSAVTCAAGGAPWESFASPTSTPQER